MERFDMQKIAWWLCMGALAVNAPRFMILFLNVDGLYLPHWLQGLLLVLTGIGSAVVLSGGGAYIAHVLAHTTGGSRVHSFLTTSWILLLVFNVVLLAPLMMLALHRSELTQVLRTPFWQWFWSISAIVAVEWMAGAGMAAYALFDQDSPGEAIKQVLDQMSAPWSSPRGANSRRTHPETDGDGAHVRRQRPPEPPSMPGAPRS